MPLLPATFTLEIPQETNFTLPLFLDTDTLPAPPFAASSPYLVGEYVSPSIATGLTFMVVVAGTSAAVEPVWPDEIGERATSNTAVFMAVRATRILDTTGYYAQLMIRDKIGGTSLLFCSSSISGGNRLQVGWSPALWQATHAYANGQEVVPTIPNGWVYAVVAAGTSGGTEPAAWNTVEGGITTSGTVTFRNVGSDENVLSSLRLALIVADTTTDWDIGVYDLQLTDTFNQITPYAYGDARMIRNLIT